MEYISSFLNYAVSSISPDPPQVPIDTITCFHFFKHNKLNPDHLHLAIGYERGFEVWDFQVLASPQLLLSIRNSGVKKLVFSNTDSFGCLLITSLYPTLDFTSSSFQVFSLAKCKTTKIINTLNDIESIEASRSHIICSTINNTLEIYQNFSRILVLNPFFSNVDSLRPVFALTDRIVAYTFVTKTGKNINLSGEIMNLASKSLESFLGQSTLLLGRSVYNHVNIVDLETNTKLQDIHAFDVPVNFIQFNADGMLMCLCPEHGQSFHVYRFQETYALIYTLYRGVSLAQVINVSFSEDNSLIVVTSNKGTSHLYTLEPSPKSLTYNQNVKDRIKLDALGCHFYNNDLIILSKAGALFRKTPERLLHICQVSRPIDFKCKIPVNEDYEAPVECYN